MSNLKYKPAGFWNGRTSNSDDFLSWMYINGMSKTDQALKDTTFHRYYRYYNDGDKPRIKRYDGMTLEETLELRTAEVTLELIKKYSTPERRRAFYKSREAKAFDLTGTEGATGHHIPGKVEPYWAKKYMATYGNDADAPACELAVAKVAELRKELAKAEAEVARKIVGIYKSFTGL